MIKKYVIILMIILFLSSCATYRVTESMTQKEDYKIFSMRGNSIPQKTNQLGPYGSLWIGGEIFVSTQGLENEYFIYWHCLVQNGLNLNKDYPFILIVDGLSYDFFRYCFL